MGRRFGSRRPFAAAIAVLVLLLGLGSSGRAAQGKIDVLAVLKAFGIGYAVDLFNSELNDFINTLTLRHSVQSRDATKVVPIVSVGTGAYVGAVQVTGPADRVALVQAVGQLEGDFLDGAVRGKALVPLDNINPLSGMRRVQGVGILAVIDIKVETPVTAPRSPGPPGSPGSPPSQNPGDDRPHGPPDWPVQYDRLRDGRYVLIGRDEINIRGNNNDINGSLRARDEIEISGNRNTVTGWIEAERVDIKGNGSGSKSRARRPGTSLGSFNLDPRAYREYASRRYSDNAKIDGIALRGIIYVDGDAVIDGDVRGRGVIAVDGDVRIRSKSIAGDIAIVAAGKIELDRSGGDIRAGLFTRREVSFSGSNNRFAGIVVADEIVVRGNNNRFHFDDFPLANDLLHLEGSVLR